MATYAEMFVLRNGSSTLLGRFIIGVDHAAQVIIDEDPATTNHATRIAWAKKAIANDASASYASMILKLSISGSQTLQTNGESVLDTDIQAMVDLYVPKIAAAGI